MQTVANGTAMAEAPLAAYWSVPDPYRPGKVVSYICGYCGRTVASEHGFFTNRDDVWMSICPFCRRPTFFEGDKIRPGLPFGDAVASLPADVEGIYDEARRCCTVHAYTAAALALRKLLMHIGVEKGAKPDGSFKYYVQYLVDAHYVPPGGNEWVAHIKDKGNEANHQIVLVTKDDARELMLFAESLLRFVYELPARMASKRV